MSIAVKDVEEILRAGTDGKEPVVPSELDVLLPIRDAYQALLCQPTGTLKMDDQGVRNVDPDTAALMYRAFIAEAVASYAQLAVAPEYSVPWSVIIGVLDGERQPPPGALWILGCESIRPDQLQDIRDRFSQNHAVRIVYEPLDLAEAAQKHFLDPVACLFWATDSENHAVLCLLVQFKTTQSRDDRRLELQWMYRGNWVYRFRNHDGPLSLIPLICADALEFQDEVAECCSDALIVHVQLNPRPGHSDFAAYRRRALSVASNSHVEILCVNWAAGVSVEGGNRPFSSVAGSAWYVLPSGVSMSDADVTRLHREGLYYSIVERWHTYFLGYTGHLLLVRKQRVLSGGPQVIAPRIAPSVGFLKTWDTVGQKWHQAPPEDGYSQFISSYGALPEALDALYKEDPLAVERALELLVGPTGEVAHWYEVSSLRAMKVGDEESICRVTVSQETDLARQGVQFRRERARAALSGLQLVGGLKWPKPVEDLGEGFRYRWHRNDPHSNIEGLRSGEPAALVFLGDNPEADRLDNVYSRVRKERQKHAYAAAVEADRDGNAAALRAVDRLCVVSRAANELHVFRPGGWASISDPQDDLADDITAET